MNSRRTDLSVIAGLTAAVYACPARLRPALALATAVGLSRVHAAGYQRAGDAWTSTVLEQVNDQRAQVTPRVDELERLAADVAGRVDELGRLTGGILVRLEVLECVVDYLADHPDEALSPRAARALTMLRQRATDDASTAHGPTLIRTDDPPAAAGS